MITPIASLKESQTHDGYNADTGLDIAVPRGTEIRAVADGTLIYSEQGHTPWNKPPDTPGSILLKLAVPQDIDGVVYTLVWYTHLSKLAYNVCDGSAGRKVKMGEYLGCTGLGNRVPHLHFGILTNREQADGDFMPPGKVAAYMRKLISLGKNK